MGERGQPKTAKRSLSLDSLWKREGMVCLHRALSHRHHEWCISECLFRLISTGIGSSESGARRRHSFFISPKQLQYSGRRQTMTEKKKNERDESRDGVQEGAATFRWI